MKAALQILALSLVVVSTAGAQALPEVCLPGTDNGQALTLRVDDRSNVHLLRIATVSGDLLYSRLGYGGALSNETIERRISRLAGERVEQLDLRLRGGVPYACYRDVRAGALKLARRIEGAWQSTMIADEDGLGDPCGIFWIDDVLYVAYQGSQGLMLAESLEGGQWRRSVIDAQGGVGASLAIADSGDGLIMVAHRRDPQGDLRLTTRLRDGRWATSVAGLPFPAGVSIRAVPVAGGRVVIAHGIRGDEASDAGMVVTYGVPGELETLVIGDEYIGGAIGAARLAGQQLGVAAREMRRNAVFGDYDGLRLYGSLPAFLDFEYLAQHDSGEIRRRYLYLDMQSDPFGLPVLAYVLERPASADDRGGAPVCIRRAVDTDQDRLPDRVEEWLGSDPEVSDTDMDGMDDGDAVLMGVHPVSGGPIPEGILLGPPDGPVFSPPGTQDAGLAVDGGRGSDASTQVRADMAGPEGSTGGRMDAGSSGQTSTGADVSRETQPNDGSFADTGRGPQVGSDGDSLDDTGGASSGGCSTGAVPTSTLGGVVTLLFLWRGRRRRNSKAAN